MGQGFNVDSYNVNQGGDSNWFNKIKVPCFPPQKKRKNMLDCRLQKERP